MWAMVTKRCPDPAWHVHFPVFHKAPNRKAVRNAIGKGVSDEAFAILEALQPYHRVPPEGHWLAMLHSLNITDKHKLLLVIAGIIWNPTSVEIKSDGKFIGTLTAPPAFVRPAHDGTILFTQRVEPFNDEVDVHFRDVALI
jgi:hypothetical protein